MAKKKLPCPHCGASMAMNSYSMNRTLLRALVKMAKGQGRPSRDLGFTMSEMSVYTKLKYWKFIKRMEDGLWRVTKRGRLFLRGEVSAYKEIFYFRDELVETAGEVFVWDVLPTQESRQKYRDAMRPYLGHLGGH